MLSRDSELGGIFLLKVVAFETINTTPTSVLNYLSEPLLN
jgi:hypothetical protein